MLSTLFFLSLFSSSYATELTRKQSGSLTIGSGATSATAIITAVDMSKSFLVFSMTIPDGDPSEFLVGGEITNSTTLSFFRDGTGSTATIQWQVFEFASGVSVQRGSLLDVDATENIPITAVDLSKSFVIATGRNDGSQFGSDDSFAANLTTATNLQLTVGANDFTEVYWQVITYEDAVVKKITTTLSSGSASTTATISPAVTDLSKAMVISNHTISGNVNADDLARTELTNSTTITYTRVGTAANLNFVTYVIEFTDETTVSRGAQSFAAGVTTQNVATCLTREFTGVFGSGNMGRQGSTTFNSDDIVGYVWFNYEITSNSNLQITRANSGATAVAPYQLVSFDYAPITYYSFASGPWDSNTSWSLTSDGSTGAVSAGVFPGRRDNVVIKAGHVISINATDDNRACGVSPNALGRSNVGPFTGSGDDMFYHTGDIIIQNGGELTSTEEVMLEGYTLITDGGTITMGEDIVNLGYMEIAATAIFSTTDDIIISGNSSTILDNTSAANDDLYIDHTDATLCGEGVVAIGDANIDPVINFWNSATLDQVCTAMTITCTAGNCPPGFPMSGTGNFSAGYTGPGGVCNGTTNGVWLRADDLTGADGSIVASWADASGNSNNAVPSAVGKEPFFYNTSSINNMPVVRFDGSNDEMRIADADILDGASGLTWLVVLRPNNLNGNPLGILGKRVDAGTLTNYSYTWYFHSSNYLNVDINTQNNRFNTGPVAFANATNYITGLSFDGTLPAASRAKVYRGETLIKTATEASAVVTASAQPVILGALNNNYSSYLGADYAEVIQYNKTLNTAERIIVNNYLSAKYDIALLANDVYLMDDSGNGDYDFDVAGIGQASDGSRNRDGQGSGIVRMFNAKGLDNDEFLLWGHNGVSLDYTDDSDVDGTIIDERLARVWRVSETSEVGTVSISFDVTTLSGAFLGSNLKLIISRDDNLFADNDVAPITGSFSGNRIVFSNVNLQNGDYFTLGNIDNTAPLPVQLVNFVAKSTNGGVTLQWETKTEINNDYFTIERSKDGSYWETLRFVDGAGDSNGEIHYEQVDEQPYVGRSYYRLKQTDFDGQYEFFGPVAVNVVGNADHLRVYPNPSNGTFTISGVNGLEADQLRLLDISGREIPFTYQKDNNNIQITLSTLNAGMYLLQINNGEETVVKKLMVR